MSNVVSLIRRATLRLNPADDVVIAARPLSAGTRVDSEGIECLDAIPAGHKVAVRAIAKGAPVKRYNQIIGFATQDIAAGQHVHTHNLAFEMFERDYAVGVDLKPTAQPTDSATFMGIVRADGRVATRNYIGVISTVNCSASVSKYVAAHFTPERMADFPNVDGVVPITHSSGCGMASSGDGIDLLRKTIAGYCRHVNFAGVVIIGLGCEANQMDALFQAEQMNEGSLLKPLVIQTSGGSRTTVEAGVAAVASMLPTANAVHRQRVSASHITIGLQCGGSDGYSGITANPALGAACDLLVAHGGNQSDLLQLHRPEVCYPALGFAITSKQKTTLAMPGGGTLPVVQLVAVSGERRENIIYWTRLGEFFPTSGSEQRSVLLRSAMQGFVPDGVLVRASLIDDDSEAAFAQQVPGQDSDENTDALGEGKLRRSKHRDINIAA